MLVMWEQQGKHTHFLRASCKRVNYAVKDICFMQQEILNVNLYEGLMIFKAQKLQNTPCSKDTMLVGVCIH